MARRKTAVESLDAGEPPDPYLSYWCSPRFKDHTPCHDDHCECKCHKATGLAFGQTARSIAAKTREARKREPGTTA